MPQFRAWTEALNAPWTSEHLSIFHVRGPSGEQPCGFLMPPLQTEAGVSLAARNITRRAAALGKPFAFETGVNYFAPRSCEMPDGEFFRAVAEAADCGILLDLTNLWANHKNGRAEIHDVLVRLPFERVWEVHLAGLEFAHGHWLDAHSNGIDDELVDIASDVVADLPNLGAIIFEIAPDRIDQFWREKSASGDGKGASSLGQGSRCGPMHVKHESIGSAGACGARHALAGRLGTDAREPDAAIGRPVACEYGTTGTEKIG